MNFKTKSTGKEYDVEITGAQRDSQDEKPRYDLVGLHGLRRLAELYARGAKKYAERNWEKGQRTSRTVASLWRHLVAYQAGDREEDHLAAIAFNAFSLMHVEEQVELGKLPAELLDLEFYKPVEKSRTKNMIKEMIVAFLGNEIGRFTAPYLRDKIVPLLPIQKFNELMVELKNEGVIEGQSEPDMDFDWTYALRHEEAQVVVHVDKYANSRCYLCEPDGQDSDQDEDLSDSSYGDYDSAYPDTDY